MRILLGAPIRQKPEVFRAYLESLERLEKNCTVDYRFYFHNCDLSHLLRGLRARVSYEIITTEDIYVCDNLTHRWDQQNIAAVAMIKNRLIKDCLEEDYDYLFLVDSDLILHPRTLLQLLSRQKDIVANIFWTRWEPHLPPQPNAWDMDQYAFFEDEEGQPAAFKRWREPGCYPCGGTGACILIHRGVLEAGVSYELIPNLSLFGEDRHFCIRAMVHGFQPWIETTYPATHLYREEDYQQWLKEVQCTQPVLAGDDNRFTAGGLEERVPESGGAGVEVAVDVNRDDLVSIVIPVYNELFYTRLCLDSLRRVTTWPYELIVVDNGSTDGTPDYLKSFPDIKVIRNSSNLGFARGCNQGIKLARGNYILLLNNDTVVTPGWLENLVDCARSSADIGLVGPRTNFCKGEQSLAATYSKIAEMQEFARRFNREGPDQWFELPRLIGFCLLIKREVIEKIGLLDESFGLGGYEDDDYYVRAREAGYRLMVAGNTFVHHFGNTTFAGNKIDMLELLEDNWGKYVEKWGLNRSEKSRPALSLCMIVKNEEEYLPRCLASVQGVVDEIIIVDTGSTDRTVEIARSFGAKVFHHPWRGDFSEARNVSLEHATGDWILFLDADEELVEEDRDKLRDLLHDRINEGFYLSEINFVGEQPGMEAVVNMAFRLFRNRKEYRFTGAIHEQIVACIQRRNPNVGFSQVRINHYGYLNKPSVEKNKISRNLDILLKEVQKNPGDNFTRFNLGVEYMRLGQYDKALEQYQKAFRKLPSLEVAYASVLLRNIALCLKELKRYKEALKVLADALQAYPDYTDLVFLKGLVYLEMKRYREAAETFKECLRRGESGQRHITQQGVGGYKAWLALGDTCVRLGDEREAVKAYTRAMKANSRFPVPVYRLASLLLPREEVEEVKAFFARYLDLEARDVLLNLSQAFAREGKYEEALAYLDELISREGKTAHLSFARGEYLLNLKRYTEAVGEFEAVPRESEYFYPALLEKAFCHMLQGHYDIASRELAAVGDSPLYYVHGITYQYLLGLLAREKPRQVAFTQREDGDKFAALAWDVLGKLLELQEFEAFEKGLALLEGVEDAAKPLKLGKLYYRYGYLESAAEELLRAVREGVSDSEAFAILGEACREKGLLEDAEVFYSQAMALDPEQVSHYTALTSILARQRKYQRAKEVVKLGLAKFPGSELLKASLQTVEMAAGLTG